MASCLMPCDAPDASGTLGIMHACSRQLAQPATSVDSTHQQQQHKQPAKGKASAGKPKPAKVPAAGSKAKSPRSSSGASATKKQCVAVRHAPTAKHEPACEDDEGDDCELSDWAAAAAGTDRKGPISHSTVEKQRRDRINALIDLLAEQVPPVSSKYSGSQAAVRRPKHVVLSDTLALLSKIRSALKEQEQTISRLAATTAGAPAALVFEQLPDAAASEQPTPCGSCAALQAGAEECPHVQAPVTHAALASLTSTSMHGTTEAVSCAPGAPAPALIMIKADQPHEQVTCSPAAAPGPLLVSAVAPDASGVVSDCSDVSVVEQAPGCFAVSLRCPPKPDLYTEVCEGLSNLPVTITELRLLPDTCAPTTTATRAGAADPEDVLMRASLRLDVRPGATVTPDQLQLALYMSVCWGCPQLPPLDDAMVGTCSMVPAAPCAWGAEAAEYLLPQACGWEACDSLVGCGPDMQHLHPTSSSASMDSWYDIL